MHTSRFELPLVGARAYAAVAVNGYATEIDITSRTFTEQTSTCLRPQPDTSSCRVFPQGTAFIILAEMGEYWQISLASEQSDSSSYYVRHDQCFLNVADVMPSILYQNTNGSASVMHSSGRVIAGITGEQLYQASGYNARLGREESIMPVLYHTAKKIATAQASALAEGNSLVIYELFRPQATQQAIVDCLSALAEQDEIVKHGITAEPWEMDWFIATGVSTHQGGMAMDVALAKVEGTHLVTLRDGSTYTAPDRYTLYTMPIPIHELSTASASLAHPVPSRSDTAWRTAPLAPSMNEPAMLLRGYCTNAGMTPLASEWWHFNDLCAVVPEGSEWFRLGETT